MSALRAEAFIPPHAVVLQELGEIVCNGPSLSSINDRTLWASLDSLNLPSEVYESIKLLIVERELRELSFSPLEQLHADRRILQSGEDHTIQGATRLCRTLLFDQDLVPSRDELWNSILEILPPNIRTPPGRLQTLLDQARRYQASHCMCHDAQADTGSLHFDHACDPYLSLPTDPRARLDGHRDEVWAVAIGRKHLASASKDRSICIWDLETFQPVAVLNGHTEPCTCLAWAADGIHLLSGSNDCTVRLWAPQSASPLVRVYEHHAEPISAVVWYGETQFISASVDKSVVICDIGGKLITVWFFPGRVTDIVLSYTSQHLAVVSSERKISLVTISDQSIWHDEPVQLLETHPIIAIASSTMRDELLASSSRNPPSIHLWDVAGKRIVQTYRGHQQGKCVLRPAFAGDQEQLVVSGSEDGKIYIWNRLYGSLLFSFDAHADSVNAVQWSILSESLVSCSDDRTIKIWTSKRVSSSRRLRNRSGSNFTDD